MSSEQEGDPLAVAAAQWERLVHLNQHLVRHVGAEPPGLEPATPDGSATGIVPGAPPTVPAMTAEIEQAREQFCALTVELGALEGRLEREESVGAAEIGAALDKARAWVEYLGLAGPLRRGFPPFMPTSIYIDALARISELERVAQQWVDVLSARWERIFAAPQAQARVEQQCLEQVARAEQAFGERRSSFSRNSSTMSSAQIEGSIRDVNDLLASLPALGAGAGAGRY
jgi:hypothetical protein